MRSLSFKTEDDFDDKLYSISKKKGMTKSAFIRNELEKAVGAVGIRDDIEAPITIRQHEIPREKNQNGYQKNLNNSANSNANANSNDNLHTNTNTISRLSDDDKKLFEDLYYNFVNNKGQTDKKIKEDPKEKEDKAREDRDRAKEDKAKEDKAREDKKITKDDKKNHDKQKFKNMKEHENNESVKKRLHDGGKIDFSKLGIVLKDNLLDRRIPAMNEESEYANERERYRKFREEERFNDAVSDMYNRIKKIDARVCEDGDCTRREIGELRKQVDELKAPRGDSARLAEISKDLSDLKSNTVKMEVCPDCGEKAVLHMSSFCSNCGSRISEWTDDSGVKITSWKPFWERNKKSSV